MGKAARWFVRVIVCLVPLTATHAEQSFKVFVYNPPLYQNMQQADVDSSMKMFQNFGTDWFLAHTSRTLYQAVKNTPMRVVSNNGQAHEYYGNREDFFRATVQLSSRRPYYLFDYIYFGAYLATGGTRVRYELGYDWDRSSGGSPICGTSFFDDGIRRAVLLAKVGVDQPGYFFKRFNGEMGTPIDYGLDPPGYRSMVMKARMKIGSKAGPSNTAVARLIARNPWHDNAVSNDALDIYYTEIIKVSFWTFNGDKYFFVVNKRTQANDSSRVNLFLNTGPGLTEIALIDSVTKVTETVSDSSGVYTRYALSLHSGEGRLYRVRTPCCNKAGDFNNDEVVDISDAFDLLDFQGSGVPVPPCPEEADAGGSGGQPDISDFYAILDYLSSGVPPLSCPT